VIYPKRLIWFSAGAVVGAAGTVYGYVRAREAAKVEPDQVADALVGAARRATTGVRDLVADTGNAIRDAESEIRDGLDRRPG